MDYNFREDLKTIREILEITQTELANQLGVEQKTISRNETGQNNPTSKLLEQVYDYAFKQNIKLNKLKMYLRNIGMTIEWTLEWSILWEPFTAHHLTFFKSSEVIGKRKNGHELAISLKTYLSA